MQQGFIKKNNKLKATPFLYVVILLMLYSSLFARINVVGGNSSGNSGNIACNETPKQNKNGYSTIQDAINASSFSDEIVICSGTYEESLYINVDNLTLRSESSNRNDVLIINESRNDALSINGVNGLILKGISIEQARSGYYGISIKPAYSQNIVFNNISISSINRDTLNIASSIGRVTITDSFLKAFDTADAIDLGGNSNGGFYITNSTLEAGDNAIEINNDINTGVFLEGVSINAPKGYAFYSSQNIWNSFEINNSFIAAEGGIRVNGQIGSGVKIYKTEITTTGDDAGENGIYLASQVSGGVDFDEIIIDSQRYGAYFGGDLNSGVNFTNIFIDAVDTGIHFDEKINNGVTIKNANITSSQERGIDFQENVYNNFILESLHVQAYEEGIYLDNKDMSPLIKTSSFESSHGDGARLRIDDWNNLSIQSSCFTTQDSNSYGLYLDLDNSNSVEINGNCFYAPDTNHLATSSKSGYDWSGNYWDGNSGNYTLNNILDTAPLNRCSNSCSLANTPILEYRFDKCYWEGEEAEVKNSSSNDYNASIRGDITNVEEGFIYRSGEFDGDEDYIQLDDGSFLNGLDEITVMAWVKNSDDLVGNNNGIFFTAEANSKDNRLGIRYDEDGASGGGKYLLKASVQTTQCNDNSDCVQIETQSNIMQKDVWHHVVMTWKSGEGISVYNNGQKLNATYTSGDNIGGTIDAVDFLRIGYGAKGEYWKGNIDEFKIFTNSLSDTEIANIYLNESLKKNYDGSQRDVVLCTVTPLAEYRFDECLWSGANGEVKDFSPYQNHATPFDLDNTDNGKLCKSTKGYENPTGYIRPQSNIEVGDSWSLSTWVKFPLNNSNHQRINNNYYHVFASVEGGGDLAYLWKKRNNKNKTGWGVYTLDGSVDIDFDSTVSDGWHHITFVKSGNSTEFFLDGVSQGSINKTVQGKINYLLTSGDNPSGQAVGGRVDEFKVFEDALNKAKIEEIISNEQDEKNFDGTARTCNTCGVSTCFTDNFDGRDNLGQVWSVIKNQNFTPQVIDDKLVLTNNKGNIASGITLSGDFPSGDNLVEIEYEHNAYGGNGADGMVVVFSDANVTPVAGSYGGSLGYAQRNGQDGFAGGWLGFGLDEWGNFSNPTEGRVGGIGFTKDAFAVRGRGKQNSSGEWRDGYEYITGTPREFRVGSNWYSLDPGIDDTSSNEPAPGHMYKFTIDTRNSQTLLKVERKIDASSSYETIINTDATQSAQAPSSFKLSFTGATGGSNNYHVFDDLSIKALYCGSLGYEPDADEAQFDAWNTNTDHTNRFISTKVVNQSFDVTLGSLNETLSGTQEFTGTVCTKVVDSLDNSLSDWKKISFNNDLTKIVSFDVQSAIKDARIFISWKDSETTCPLSGDFNSTLSSDNFAIRPDSFTLSNIPALAYAKEPFSIDISASGAQNYNETYGSSFQIQSSASKSSCNAVLNVSSFNFVDGIASGISIDYADVGDINISISEKNDGSEFASVDRDDTSDIQRLISPDEVSLEVQPYEIIVQSVDVNTTEGKNWLYMADVSDLAYNVVSNIQANDANESKLEYFTPACYAKDIQIQYVFDTTSGNNGIELSYLTQNASLQSASKTLSGMDKVLNVPANSFLDSSANVGLSFNIDRLYNTPYEPINTTLNEIIIVTDDKSKIQKDATESALITADMSKNFYYGRVHVKDISTNQQSVSHSVYTDIFCSTCSGLLNNFQQRTLNWYINEDDDISNNINMNAKQDFLFSSGNKTGINIINQQNINSGEIGFMLNNTWGSSDEATIHLQIPYWLWYSRYKAYNSLQDCSTHPCFKYSYLKTNSNQAVQSGSFEGSSISNDFNTSRQKQGVKTFR